MHGIPARHVVAGFLAGLAITSVGSTATASGRSSEYISPATKRARRFVRSPTTIERAGLLLLVRRHRHDPNYFIERHSRLAGLCVSREDPQLATMVLASPHADELIYAVERRGRLRWRPVPERAPLPSALGHLTIGTLVAACRHDVTP